MNMALVPCALGLPVNKSVYSTMGVRHAAKPATVERVVVPAALTTTLIMRWQLDSAMQSVCARVVAL